MAFAARSAAMEENAAGGKAELATKGGAASKAAGSLLQGGKRRRVGRGAWDCVCLCARRAVWLEPLSPNARAMQCRLRAGCSAMSATTRPSTPRALEATRTWPQRQAPRRTARWGQQHNGRRPSAMVQQHWAWRCSLPRVRARSTFGAGPGAVERCISLQRIACAHGHRIARAGW